ncbi:MAG: PAS domain S-box protein [Desulfobulbaceae bacterium]|nr:PAS domain S-box protein [Desulfobulbaceae bacterium]
MPVTDMFYHIVTVNLVGDEDAPLIGLSEWVFFIMFSISLYLIYRMILVTIRYGRLNRRYLDCEKQIDGISRTVTDAIVMIDGDDNIKFWNKQAEKLFGYNSKEILDKKVHDLLVPQRYRQDAKQSLDHFWKTGEGAGIGKIREVYGLRKDGTEFVGECALSGFKIDDQWWAVGILRDIRERKEREKQLLRARDSLARAQRVTRMGHWEWDVESDSFYCSEEVYRILGEKPKTYDIFNEMFVSLAHEEDKERVRRVLRTALENNHSYTIDYRIRRNGEEVYLSQQGEVQLDETNDPIRIIGIIRDVTDARQAELALSDLSERLSLATKVAKIGIFDWDVKKDEMVWDDAMYALYGLDRKDFKVGFTSWQDKFHPKWLDEAVGEIQAALVGKKDLDTVFRIIHRDGAIRFLKVDGAVYRGPDGAPKRMIGVNYDITSQLQAKEELKRLNEMLELRVKERTQELEASRVAALSLMQDADLQRRRAEEILERLRSSNDELNIYSHLIMQSPITVVITDPEGEICFVNPKFSELTGYGADEVIGRNPRILNAGVQKKEVYEELWATIKAGNIWRGELCNKKKNGELFWEKVAISPIRDDQGELTHFAALKEDITSHKEAEEKLRESEERFRIISSSAGSAIIMVDHRGLVTYWNLAAEKIFGWNQDDALGRDVHQLLSPEELLSRCWDGVSTFARTGEGVLVGKSIEISAVRKDGTYVPVEISLSGVKIKGKWNAIAVINDISARKRSEEEIYRAMELAESATRAKSDFLANMSHEIRTPLNAVIGLTHLVKETNLDSRQYDYIHKISVSSEALLTIINDILDFSKIEAGMLEIEHTHFSLSGVLSKLSDIIEIKAAEKGIAFIIDVAKGVPDILVGDPFRLSQILINLVTNGIKFTERGEVKVIVEEENKDSKAVSLRFTVMDTGIGMDESQCASLFSAFKQAEKSTTRKYGGTGLGLAICKQLVGLMGGEIFVSSVPGQGTSFIFRVGFEYDETTRFEPLSQQFCAHLEDIRVWLLMADKQQREKCIEELRKHQIEHLVVKSSEEVLTRATTYEEGKRKYEVLLVDLDGLDDQTRRVMEDDERFQAMRAVVVGKSKMTATEDSRQKSIGKVYLEKPIDYTRIHEKVIGLFDLVCEPGQACLGKKQQLEHSLGEIRGARVLLAEDNIINQQVAGDLLTRVGMDVVKVMNGEEAVSKVKEEPFDLVLMDIQMPVLNGLEATRLIRSLQDEKIAGMPIIAMTAHAMAEARNQSREAGMNDHVTKPVDPDELYRALVKWIRPRKVLVSQENVATERAEVKPSSSSMPVLEGIDTGAALKRMGGNVELYIKLLRSFAPDNKNLLPELRKALVGNDRRAAVMLAHTLKGVSGNLGISNVYLTATKLEHSLDVGKDDVRELLEKVEKELQDVFKLLDQALSSDDSQRTTKGNLLQREWDAEKVRLLCLELKERLQLHDLAAEKSMGELMPYFRDNSLDLAQLLSEDIDLLEFDRALERLNTLVKYNNLKL